ncbi:MAG TPA: glutaminyl-peptide cyclotransferase [Bacteroidales bacterium]|nr:glutaminyl-peptide cyclotransferase [Bacteroidales bacterium]
MVLLATIFLVTGCKGRKPGNLPDLNNNGGVNVIQYTVANTYPHSTTSFTEGLIFHDNKLFESTGSPGEYPFTRSVIGIDDLATGKLDIKIEINRNKYFGEGILFLNNKLYQLTYKNQMGFIYNADDFRQTGTFRYASKEGWGMTTDGKYLIMSDGTNYLTYLDPDSMTVVKRISVTYNGSPALYVNELEYINGFIYANIWTTNYIARINPDDGKITGLLDLTTLFIKAQKKYRKSEATNGIAWDPVSDRIFVTGKLWPYLFEIRFPH